MYREPKGKPVWHTGSWALPSHNLPSQETFQTLISISDVTRDMPSPPLLGRFYLYPRERHCSNHTMCRHCFVHLNTWESCTAPCVPCSPLQTCPKAEITGPARVPTLNEVQTHRAHSSWESRDLQTRPSLFDLPCVFPQRPRNGCSWIRP